MDNITLQYNNRDHFQPVISAVASKNEIEQIFAIPFKNCVGTYYDEDGITALECSGEIANKKMVFPLYDSYPLAPGQIFTTLPINKDEILWGLNLIFDIVNIKKHSDLAFGLGLSDYAEDIKVIDNHNYIILFKLRAGESTYKYSLVKLHPLDYSVKSAWGNYDRIAELTSEDALQNDLDHCQRDGYFFFYSEKNHALQVYDSSLKKTVHPLVDAVAGYPFSISSILVHPVFPFALFVSRIKMEDGFYNQSFNLVRWEHPDKEKRVIVYPFKEVLGQQNNYDFFSRKIQFSPDGNWLIVHDGTIDDTIPEIVAFPIQKDNPMYLGKPVFLGKVMREGAKMLSHAWIEDPMKYVICDGKLLYSWELGKLSDRLVYKK